MENLVAKGAGYSLCQCEEASFADEAIQVNLKDCFAQNARSDTPFHVVIARSCEALATKQSLSRRIHNLRPRQRNKIFDPELQIQASLTSTSMNLVERVGM